LAPGSAVKSGKRNDGKRSAGFAGGAATFECLRVLVPCAGVRVADAVFLAAGGAGKSVLGVMVRLGKGA
jgi:hypothetical protein